jgi:hypothetical protein
MHDNDFMTGHFTLIVILGLQNGHHFGLAPYSDAFGYIAKHESSSCSMGFCHADKGIP